MATPAHNADFSETSENRRTSNSYENEAYTIENTDQLRPPLGFNVDSTVNTSEPANEKSSNYDAYVSTVPKKPKSKCNTSFSGCEITFLVLGSFSTLLSFAMLAGGYQAMFDAILKSQLQITPGSRAFEMWKNTPVPLYLHIYFFNITNGDKFQNKGAIPKLVEVGPYCYREFHKKQNLDFHPNKTVTFFQERWWQWDAECSGNNTQDDIITTLNTVPIDPVLEWLSAAVNGTGIISDVLRYVLPPGLTAYDKFAWFYKRNHSLSYDGMFNMKTGEDGLESVGQIDLWNQTQATDFFDSPCNKVTGSAGEMWPPNLKKTFIEFYSSDLCMTMKLYYKEDVKYSHGLEGNRYWGNMYTFSNESTVAGHQCYCVKGTCAPYGLLNAESCRMGAPAFISFPHFFNADPFLLHQVKGLNPVESKHAFVMDLIPEIGTPMHVAARMQINMFVRPYKTFGPWYNKTHGITILENVTETYVPLMWFEEIADLSDDLAGELGALMYIMKAPLVTSIFYFMLAVGFITVTLVLVRHWSRVYYLRVASSYKPIKDS